MTGVNFPEGPFPEYDLSNPAEVDMAGEAAALRMREEKVFLKELLDTYSGRAFMWMLLQQAGTDDDISYGEAPMATARQLGKRSIGLWAQNLVFTISPEVYIIMRREAIDRAQRYAQAAGLTDLHEDKE